jgi:UDP-N-acetylmuramoyl-L-alanyl-D-glutamate--2,6-diaminopimelate ligase
MSMPAEYLHTSPTLADLLQGFADAPRIPVGGIASDSRALGQDDVFLACQGASNHGLDFAADAVSAGVVAIVYDATTAGELPAGIGVPMIGVPHLADKLGEIANRFHGRPSEQLDVIGVTGTNGKSTVAWLISNSFELLDERCAYLGTLNHALTTPPVVDLHGKLAEFRDAGAGHAAIEISSHALAQNRVDGVHFEVALFTNLTRDHLDYHANMRDYAEAKAKLLIDCRPGHRIINLDSEFGAELAKRCVQNVTTVSTNFDRVANGRPYVFVQAVVATEQGSDITVRSSWGDGRFALQMPGDFNVANAVIVLALLLHKGVSMDDACEALSKVDAPPGRMQRVAAVNSLPSVYIDYAHSPNAIEVALRALRAHCRGRLWCVFGCGGDRDKGKRPMMGKAAQRLADHVVVTSDNPRTESPAGIIDDIVSGLASPHAATVIEDRAAAIGWAIAHARASDVVLIAGKGHEDYQDTAAGRIAFSDHGVAEAALAARAAESGE